MEVVELLGGEEAQETSSRRPRLPEEEASYILKLLRGFKSVIYHLFLVTSFNLNSQVSAWREKETCQMFPVAFLDKSVLIQEFFKI